MSTPIDFPVMIKDDQVAFSRRVLRGNYCTYEIDVESLYTPYGFLVPMQNDSFDFLDYFEYGWEGVALHMRVSTAVLIDHKGRIYELTLGSIPENTTPEFSKLRAVPNQRKGYVRSRMSRDDQRARSALALAPDLAGACQLMNKNLDTFGVDYIVMDIDAIVKRLVKEDSTKMIPYHTHPKEKSK